MEEETLSDLTFEVPDGLKIRNDQFLHVVLEKEYLLLEMAGGLYAHTPRGPKHSIKGLQFSNPPIGVYVHPFPIDGERK